MSNIRIEIATKEKREDIRDFLLEYFRVDEPISRSINLSKEDAKDFFLELVDLGLKEPTSFVALNEKNEIVGCRLNEIVDSKSSDHKSHYNECNYPDSVKKIDKFLYLLSQDLEKLLLNLPRKIMKFIIVSVHPEYQRRGIAKELIERSMKLAIDQGCDYVCTGATAMRSQQLFEKKLAFDTLRIIDYKDYRDQNTNEQIFNCDDGTTCAKLMVKKLR